jgi:hypothetical protein
MKSPPSAYKRYLFRYTTLLFAITVSEKLLPKIKFGVKFALLFIALMITIDLIKNLVIIGRRKLARS